MEKISENTEPLPTGEKKSAVQQNGVVHDCVSRLAAQLQIFEPPPTIDHSIGLATMISENKTGTKYIDQEKESGVTLNDIYTESLSFHKEK